MRNEMAALLVFVASVVLTSAAGPAAEVSGLGVNEIYLVFMLVFTFAVGLEVVK